MKAAKKVQGATMNPYLLNLQEALDRFEARIRSQRGYQRWPTKADAREALDDVGEVVATIGLLLPLNKSNLVTPILDAIAGVTGRVE